MPTLEETLSDITSEVSQIASSLSQIGNATAIKAGLVKISDGTAPDDNSIPTVAFLKDRNILGESGEAGGGLPQIQLDKVNALPPAQVLAALATLPVSLNGLAGKIIAVNTTGSGYELIVAPTGGGGGGGTTTLPVNVAVDRFTGNNTATQFTLSQSPTNSNALHITISGISIDPAIYTVSGTTLTFTDAPPTTETSGIVVRHLGTVAALADNSVATIKIINKAVTLAKMADGTPGKYLKFNATTGVIEEADIVATVADNSIGTVKLINKNVTLAKIADGTPGKFLKFNSSTGVIEESDVTNATDALVLLQTQNASNSSAIIFSSTYLTSAYTKYIIELIDVVPATNSITIQMYFSSDNGTTYYNNNEYHYSAVYTSNATVPAPTVSGYAQSSQASFSLGHAQLLNTLNTGLCATIAIYNPLGTTNHKKITFDGGIEYASHLLEQCHILGLFDANTTAINNIKLAMGTGNITSGKFKLYGVL